MDATTLRVEIDQSKRVLVTIDVEKHCRFYANERAAFVGTDAEFVMDSIHEMLPDLISETGEVDEVGGVSVLLDYDEVDIGRPYPVKP